MSLARHIAVMRNAAFLRVLDDDALKLLAFGSEAVALKPRDVLFEAGDEADGAVLVLGGQLRLVPSMAHTVARVASVGFLLDDVALICANRRKVTAVAQTSCETLLIPRAQMLKILEEYPGAARRLQGLLAARTNAFVSDLDRLRGGAFAETASGDR